MESQKNYLIKVFGLGYRGQYRLTLFGKVDIDRINDEAIHLIITKKMILERDKFYSHNVRITYEEL